MNHYRQLTTLKTGCGLDRRSGESGVNKLSGSHCESKFKKMAISAIGFI